mmetsp:Transcript_28614/g.80667  ORF Transcript_28614/g.80667 Transcript_28614/m.80667 type:complete len:320 (+) Transcript_28614:2084-3043(+)
MVVGQARQRFSVQQPRAGNITAVELGIGIALELVGQFQVLGIVLVANVVNPLHGKSSHRHVIITSPSASGGPQHVLLQLVLRLFELVRDLLRFWKDLGSLLQTLACLLVQFESCQGPTFADVRFFRLGVQFDCLFAIPQRLAVLLVTVVRDGTVRVEHRHEVANLRREHLMDVGEAAALQLVDAGNAVQGLRVERPRGFYVALVEFGIGLLLELFCAIELVALGRVGCVYGPTRHADGDAHVHDRRCDAGGRRRRRVLGLRVFLREFPALRQGLHTVMQAVQRFLHVAERREGAPLSDVGLFLQRIQFERPVAILDAGL